MFSPLKDKGGVPNGWVNHLMQIFAVFMLMGFFLSWLIPETKGKSLEELSGENIEDALRLRFEEQARREAAQKSTKLGQITEQ